MAMVSASGLGPECSSRRNGFWMLTTVYRADGTARLLRPQEELEGEDVLPGLIIPLADLFR